MVDASRRLLAPLALLVAAFVWGVVWYPYRLLEQAGLSGALSSLLTYLVALAIMLAATLRRWTWPPVDRRALALVALAAGWTNLAYVLAVIHGEIMRVMLLFYLAPLWTVVLARLLLGEHTGRWGWTVILLSLAGAWTMLHDPERGLPLPANAAEWLGLSAGLSFALSNVLTRRIKHVPTQRRSLWVFSGVVLISLAPALADGGASGNIAELAVAQWWLLLLTGALLVLATVSVQYGLAHTVANRAIVILLTELVVAAVFSWWWAGEVMDRREWLGGAMIVAASLFSGKLERPGHA